MRTSAVLIATLGSVVLGVAGCSTGSQSLVNGLPGNGDAQGQRIALIDSARSGRWVSFNMPARFPQIAQHSFAPATNRNPRDLYVSSFYPEGVEVLTNKGYTNVGTITTGLVSPDGDFVDMAGNLYVTDYDRLDVAEYKPGHSSPSFTYTQSMIDPVDVSVDGHGNVYEADNDGGYVNEYAQKSNTVITSCPLGSGVEGVAVDANGDVFVAYNKNKGGPGGIAEYKGGLAGCHKAVLNVTLKFAGGMALDAQDKLIVVDQLAAAVDVIDPPYSSITGTLGSGYLAPFHVTLDKANKLAFVADLYDVFVVHYPSGHVAKMLDAGWEYPAGAVDSENAAY